MSIILDAWPWLLAMVTLICLSAMFSGSEAALFSLDQAARKNLRTLGVNGRRADALLNSPDELLSSILFWNLLINMTYFAIAAIVGNRLGASSDEVGSQALLFTVTSLLMIIFFSEMLPKSLALISPIRISLIVGRPLLISFQLVRPLLPLVTASNRLASRLIWPTFEPESEISLADIERAVEFGADDAAMLQRERMAMRGLVEIAETRVSELMRPRNKLWMCTESAEVDLSVAVPASSGHLMITNRDGDMITKSINLRALRPSQIDQLNENMEPVIYVPWSAYVSQVLDEMHAHDHSVAVVVNEFGELAGAVTRDDIFRFVMSPRSDEDDAGIWSIDESENGCIRVSGSVSVRSAAKRLEIVSDGEGVTTLAGYIQRQNGRFPREGDVATFGNYQLTVTKAIDDGWLIEIRPLVAKEGESQ